MSDVNKQLLDTLKEVSQTLAWKSFGECRGFSPNLKEPHEVLELAKQAIAVAEQEQAEPVAWLYTRTFNGETFLAKQCEDWPHHTRQPLYTATPRSQLLHGEPVPRDVLMSLARDVVEACMASSDFTCRLKDRVNLSDIVDRYAAQPPVQQQAEPVALDDDMVLISRGLIGAACAAIDKKRDAPKVLALLREVAMSKAAQPPAQPAAYDRALIIEMLNSYCECVDARTHASGAVISQMDLLAAAATPPAVAVPDGYTDILGDLLTWIESNVEWSCLPLPVAKAMALHRILLADAQKGIT